MRNLKVELVGYEDIKNSLGVAYENRGGIDKDIKYCTKALNIFQKLEGQGSSGYGIVLDRVCVAYQTKRDFIMTKRLNITRKLWMCMRNLKVRYHLTMQIL